MPRVDFYIPDDPIAQGSMVPFLTRDATGKPRASMHASNAKDLIHYRKLVADLSTEAAGGDFAAKETPVTVRFEFRFDPPKTIPKGRRGMTTKPDVDKLIRACLDGMTYDANREKGVFHDDAQVVAVEATKEYANEMRPPGAYVSVEWTEPEVAIQRSIFAEAVE